MTLSDATEFIVDSEHKTAPTHETGYPNIRTPDIGRGRLLLGDVRRVSEEVYEEWTRRAVPQAGDLILAREAPVGNVAIIQEGMKVCLGQRTVLIRPDEQQVNPAYLTYLLLGREIQGIFHSLSTGSTVPHLNLSDLRNLSLPELPPLPVQRRIAGVLSAYDDLIENNARRIQLLEEMAQAVYREWFVHFRFPGHEDTAMRETEALGPVPAGWEVAKLKDVADVNRANVSKGDAPEQIHYITISCVEEGDISDIEKMPYSDSPSRAKRIVRHGDILWSKVRPNLKGYGLVLNPAPNTIASTGFAVISPDVVPYSYLYPALTTENFVTFLTNRTSGAAYPAVKVRDFKNAEVLLPPQDVLEAYDEKVRPFYELKERLSARNETLLRTRDLLLPPLVSGEVAVGAAEEAVEENDILQSA